jgi:diaminohydroxyphosphoribosylaminopyrimidine deaminase/5-amino-6-(5-phosphoribosylamino)uracil reductase
MHRCIELAVLGAGHVAPNPMVGAVLVCDEKIIGEGYHRLYGQAHAEVNCVASVCEENKNYISRATLYVSLEPCIHHGKTPPCVDLILEKKIPRVVIGCKDPFDRVNGKGIDKLKNAGVEVVPNILEKECIELNKRFFTYHKKHRPYIILKWAQSVNAKMARSDYSRVFISNEFTNRLVHKWRAEESAILVGTNTARHDDPELTVRHWKGKNPVRIIIDMNLNLLPSLKIFNNEAHTIIFNSVKQEKHLNLSYYQIVPDEREIHQIVHALYQLGIQSVMVEGGAHTLQRFIDENTWDEARMITNTQLYIDNGISSASLSKAKKTRTENIQDDRIDYFGFEQ